jgi:hypothetical protein
MSVALNDPDTLSKILMQNDLLEDYQDWDSWKAICGMVLEANPRGEAFVEFNSRYHKIMQSGDHDKLTQALWIDQMDNYTLGSFAAFGMDLPRELPLVAWAAENKRLYEGWKGEISNLRSLLVMGFDQDAIDPDTGNTALHAMCGLKWGKGIHLRGIGALLDAGANPNIANKNGDSAMLYLCGSYPFSREVQAAFEMLLEAGGDMSFKDNSAITALEVLKDTQERFPEEARLAMIERCELETAVSPVKAERVKKHRL